MNLTQTVRRRRGRTHPATLQSTDRRGYPSDSQQKHTRSPCNTKAPKSHRGDSSVHFIQQKSANLPAASAKGTGEFSHPIGPSATSCLSLLFFFVFLPFLLLRKPRNLVDALGNARAEPQRTNRTTGRRHYASIPSCPLSFKLQQHNNNISALATVSL